MGQERITLSKKELKRYKVIEQLIQGFITGGEAAELLGLSTRQVYRLKKRVLEEGETGIIHKNRGRKPAHALPDETKQNILALLSSDRYRNCNDHHFAELLAKYEGIRVSPSTVRRIRCEAKMKPKRKRRPPKAHRPRERKPQAGMLVQMDASPHHWLEERSQPFSLHAAIDDATGKIVGAVFRPEEDTAGYFMITRQMIENEGIPMGIYSDRHNIFRSPKEEQTIEQELAGEPIALSQFGQALKELGVTHIKATTPQAKGRIERLFETLQDRWVVELRLRNVNTLEEANRILPELIEDYNQKFAVEPRDPESAFVPLEPGQLLDLILCYRDERTLGPGETIAYQGKTYKIHTTDPNQTIPLKTRVEVRQTLDGELFIWYKGKSYPLQETAKPQRQTVPEQKKASSEKKSHKPAANHPWRQYKYPITSRISQRA
jgi:transposase